MYCLVTEVHRRLHPLATASGCLTSLSEICHSAREVELVFLGLFNLTSTQMASLGDILQTVLVYFQLLSHIYTQGLKPIISTLREHRLCHSFRLFLSFFT